MAASQQPWTSALRESTASPVDSTSKEVRVLVIDADEVASARMMADLRPLRHLVSAVRSTTDAVGWLDSHQAEIVVLCADSGPSALHGARLLRSACDLPLIVVGPDATAESRVGAFDQGAEDYIARPVLPAGLDRRVRVLVRRERLRQPSDELIGPQGLALHPRLHEAYVGGESLSLTPKEFALLQVLLERRDEVVAPDQLSLEVWGYETFGSRNFVEAHISRLRRKLARAGMTNAIRTVRTIGYLIR